jgi:vacuolar-type H+-ATPase subunit D/Vma8
VKDKHDVTHTEMREIADRIKEVKEGKEADSLKKRGRQLKKLFDIVKDVRDFWSGMRSKMMDALYSADLVLLRTSSDRTVSSAFYSSPKRVSAGTTNPVLSENPATPYSSPRRSRRRKSAPKRKTRSA